MTPCEGGLKRSVEKEGKVASVAVADDDRGSGWDASTCLFSLVISSNHEKQRHEKTI